MDREELERIADGMLAPHRSAPPPPRADEPVRDEELPPALRLMKRIDPGWSIDRERFERLKRSQAAHRRMANLEAAVQLIGGALLLAFLWAAYSGF